jgi:hypothetical protein
MDTELKRSRGAEGRGLERAIVLQLLREDCERRWSLDQLRAELEVDRSEVGRDALEEALRRLVQEGVLCRSEQAAWASNAARTLDELGLISL